VVLILTEKTWAALVTSSKKSKGKAKNSHEKEHVEACLRRPFLKRRKGGKKVKRGDIAIEKKKKKKDD